MSDDLDTLMAENAARRESERAAEAEREADALELLDKLDHPAESDATRARRKADAAKRDELRRLGVRFDDAA